MTVVSPSVLVMLMSALTVTVVVTESVLLPLTGSKVPVETVALLLTDGPVKVGSTWTTKVIVAVACGARSGNEQMYGGVEPQLTRVPPIETKLVFAGRLSLTMIPVAVVPVAVVLSLLIVIV